MASISRERHHRLFRAHETTRNGTYFSFFSSVSRQSGALQEAAVQQKQGKVRATACLARMRNWKVVQAFTVWRDRIAYRKVSICEPARVIPSLLSLCGVPMLAIVMSGAAN